jgi:DNA helicase HerA-like ATPase
MDGTAGIVDHRIGRIVSLSGSQLILLLEVSSDKDARLQISTLVKTRTASTTVFGTVTALDIPLPSQVAGDNEFELVELELIGEVVSDGAGKGHFRRGVSCSPTLGDPVFAATQDDLALVYQSPSVSAVRIGTVHQDPTIPAYVVTDDLLGKHFAVVGSTGSGKSCAVALILRSILSRHPHGHAVLLDMHGEYAPAFAGMAEVLAPGNLELPYWLFNFAEMEEIVLADSKDRAVESAILSELILAARRSQVSNSERSEDVTIDTPIPYRMGDLTRMLNKASGRLDKPDDTKPYLRLKARLHALQADSRYAFMFPGLTVRDNMVQILSRLFRIPTAGKPVTIIDLSSIPAEVLNVVVSVLCRMTFDFALWSDRAYPILLVCEEAHRYCPVDSTRGFEPTKKALSRIAREGRKYGVSLCLVSQRPSELAVGVLSQCNTIFALRMNHQSDQQYVRSALSDSAAVLFDFLPSLRNAEAIAIGEGVAVPVRICFDELPEDVRPISGTARFSTAWTNEVKNTDLLAAAVERWRTQRR